MAPEPIVTSSSSGSDGSKGATMVDSPLPSPVAANQSGGLFSGPDVIPLAHPARTLVLCFDGTGDQFDADNSNVVLFFSMLKKDDRNEQMVYYQAGIGTYTSPQVATPLAAKISKTLDEMVAWNLDAHVMSGYEFLMQNYQAGDKICIFGFSRGAYTARALAGMIHKVGLLPACNHQQVPFAYKMYTKTDETGWKQSTAFKKAFSMDVDIEFIGVWDTVCSVGLIPRRLPFTTSNTALKTFRHAVSLDERRAKFKANLFNRPTKAEAKLGTHEGEMPKAGAEAPQDIAIADISAAPLAVPDTGKGKGNGTHKNGTGKKKANGKPKGQRAMEREFSMSEGHVNQTDVLEVWFSGCHCDVGGGSVPNDTRHNLARIPLRWMIRQCFLTNSGIRFHAPLLRTIGLEPSTLYPTVQDRPEALYTSPTISTPDLISALHSRDSTSTSTITNGTLKTLVNYAEGSANPPTANVGYTDTPVPIGPDGKPIMEMSEEEEDLRDALCPIYDQLSLAPYWWILELLPMRHRVQKDDDAWIGDWSVNFGKGRKIPKRHQRAGLNIHRSVKIRMDAGHLLPGGPYTPKAHWKVEPNWVS